MHNTAPTEFSPRTARCTSRFVELVLTRMRFFEEHLKIRWNTSSLRFKKTFQAEQFFKVRLLVMGVWELSQKQQVFISCLLLKLFLDFFPSRFHGFLVVDVVSSVTSCRQAKIQPRWFLLGFNHIIFTIKILVAAIWLLVSMNVYINDQSTFVLAQREFSLRLTKMSTSA